MPYKWNENSTLVFLNAYRKQPCLWNPYDVKYYDCLAKNEALRNIIKELDISELNISDCLEQIRVIREKYGQEQIRTIKELQSQKPYKSSFAWFPVVAGMLAKVINDESKLQKRMRTRSVDSVSRSTFKDRVTTSHDKNLDASNFPCAHGEAKEHNFKKPQETKQDYKARPRKNTKFTKAGYMPGDPDKSDEKGKGKHDAQLDLLLCPSCGWENTRPGESSIAAKKTYEPIYLLDDTVACPEYMNLADKPYEEYNLYRHPIPDGQGRHNDTVPCPSFSRHLSSYFRYPANISTTRRTQDTRNYASQQTRQETIVTSKPRTCTREMQLSSEQLFPERRTKQVGTSVACCNKEIQNTICVRKTNVTPPTSKCAIMLQTSNHVEEIDAARKCRKEVQSKLLAPRGELKQVAVNTAEQYDKGIQSTICVSRVNSSDCQAFERCSSTRELKQIDGGIVECPAKDTHNIISIKVLHKSTDGNYMPLIETDFKLKRLETDKYLRDNSCEKREEAERDKLALDGKKFVENEACVKETSSRDIIEIIKHNSAVTRALLQCLEKVMHPQEDAKTRSVTSLSLKEGDMGFNSSEGTICEPCKLASRNANFVTSSVIELEDPNRLPYLEEKEKDNAAAMYTKTFFEVLKHILALNSRKCAKSVREGCVRKEDATDTFIVLNEIKKCAEKILKIYTIEDCLKKRLSKKFCPRYRSKRGCPPKADAILSPIQTRASENGTDQFTATYVNLKDVEVLYEPSTLETKEHSLSENYTAPVEATAEERSVGDKEITAHTDNRDVSLDVSLSRALLRDSGTQYVPRQLQDTGVVTEHGKSFQEKISIGIQICMPALIRVIKCSNSDGILKFDKETCVRDARAACTRHTTDKCTETCPALQRLSENVYRKYIVRRRYNEAPLPAVGVSHAREKEMNRIDYRTSLLPNRNYKCDRGCKSALSYNRGWRKINTSTLELLPNRCVSKIPLYARSHKYVHRINFHKISRLYI